MPDYVTIPRSEYDTLVREVRRGIEVCDTVAALRLRLQGLAIGIEDEKTQKEIRRTATSCEEIGRLRIELSMLIRKLKEFDQDLTPVRPPSRTDIQAAFDNANDFASGKRKPI